MQLIKRRQEITVLSPERDRHVARLLAPECRSPVAELVAIATPATAATAVTIRMAGGYRAGVVGNGHAARSAAFPPSGPAQTLIGSSGSVAKASKPSNVGCESVQE